jgi:uncharacterized protein (DUF488 family)
MASAVVWTIGHSTRSLEALAALAHRHGVTTIVDVRTVPRSRHNPQWNGETLPASLRALGLHYYPLPGLGGLRRPRPDSGNTAWRNAGFRGYADYMETAEFARHLDALVALSGEAAVAIMCAEAVPWRCHRSLIADALTARGLRVEHILTAGIQPHTLHAWARVEGTRVTYPPQTRLLPGLLGSPLSTDDRPRGGRAGPRATPARGGRTPASRGDSGDGSGTPGAG